MTVKTIQFWQLCLLESRDSNSKVILTEPSPNSQRSQRPLLIRTGKESIKTWGTLKNFKHDIHKAEQEGFVLDISNERAVNVKSLI